MKGDMKVKIPILTFASFFQLLAIFHDLSLARMTMKELQFSLFSLRTFSGYVVRIFHSCKPL